MGPKRADLTGLRFGRLVVTGPGPDYISRQGKSNGRWLALCDCGKSTRPLYGSDLKGGRVASCGCIKSEMVRARNFKHGFTSAAAGSTYLTWKAMRQRCTNPNALKYKTYGAVGITIDPAWNDFGEFVCDMGLRPPGTTLDRIDNSKGYEKANCRWATPVQQAANRRIKSSPDSKPVKPAFFQL